MNVPVAATSAAQARAPDRRWPARTGAAPPVAEGFTARPETAPGLADSLVPGATVALVSREPGERMGSCGKTQLAVHAAQSRWRCGRVDLLAWVDASSRASVLAGYGEAAAAAGIQAAGPAEQVAARLTDWLAGAARPWLVVLDDLRDPADLEGLWPASPTGTVVITARVAEEAGIAGQTQARVVPVGAFSAREALSYLIGRLAGDPDQRKGAIDLAAVLGGDPCALTHAGAVIASSTMTCHDYQRHYAGRRDVLASRQADRSQVTPVAVTWRLSAERAERLSPGGATRLLLGIAALLDGQPVPGPVFTTAAIGQFLTGSGARAADRDRAWEAVRALEHTGLLTVDPASAPPLVRVSRVVAAQVRAGMAEPVLQQAAWAAADALAEAWPQQEPRPGLAAHLRSCAAALQHTAGDRLWAAEGCHALLLRAGHSLDTACLTGPATRYWTQLATTSDRLLDPGHPATLTAGSHLARALLAAGQGPEAVVWWQWAAAGRTRALGPDHPDTLAARVSLGQAMTAAGQPGQAVTVLEQAAADYERLRGPGHPGTLHARDELAAACQAAGQPQQAIEHYRRTLAGHEHLHGPRHPAALDARENLARACLAAGQFKHAISHYQKTLTGRQRALGPDHLDTIAARRHLAAAHQTAGNIATALHLHEQACAGYDRVLGPSHPDTVACHIGLAGAYQAAGRLTDAASLLRDTLARCQQALPPGHHLITTLRHTMTSIEPDQPLDLRAQRRLREL